MVLILPGELAFVHDPLFLWIIAHIARIRILRNRSRHAVILTPETVRDYKLHRYPFRVSECYIWHLHRRGST
jgi:hypothetical protein